MELAQDVVQWRALLLSGLNIRDQLQKSSSVGNLSFSCSRSYKVLIVYGKEFSLRKLWLI